jgi:hypothetical protein
MPRKRHSAEEIVAKLRQADVLLAQGQTGADAPECYEPARRRREKPPISIQSDFFCENENNDSAGDCSRLDLGA